MTSTRLSVSNNVGMTSRMTVTLRRNTPDGEIIATFSAPGNYDETCTIQEGIEAGLQFLFDALPDLVMGAVPLEIQEYIADMLEVCRIANGEVHD